MTSSTTLALAQWAAVLAVAVCAMLAAVAISVVRHGPGRLLEPGLAWRLIGLIALASGTAFVCAELWSAVGLDALLTPSTLLPVALGLVIGSLPLAVAIGADEAITRVACRSD